MDVVTYLPQSEQLEAIQYCMLLLDDENRDVLQCLLCLLNDIAKNSHIHKVGILEFKSFISKFSDILFQQHHIQFVPLTHLSMD